MQSIAILHALYAIFGAGALTFLVLLAAVYLAREWGITNRPIIHTFLLLNSTVIGLLVYAVNQIKPFLNQ